MREPFLTLAVQLEERDGARAGAGTHSTVMITSPTSGDGKTSSAISLAVTLVASGKRVVLLDFDLRKPQVAAALGIEDAHRLTALVTPDARLKDLLVPASQLQSLQVLGLVPDPEDAGLAEVASQVLPSFVEEARRMADYVVVDTPPLGEVADPLRLARQVDEIVVVMRPGNTNRGHLEAMRGLLERVDRTPMGYVVFGTDGRTGGYGYGSYGYGASRMTGKSQAGDPGVVWGGGDLP